MLTNRQELSAAFEKTHPEINLGRIDLEHNPVLAVRFLATKPPYLSVITQPSASQVKPEYRKIRINNVETEFFYDVFERGTWRSLTPSTGLFSPFGPMASYFDRVGALIGWYNEHTKNIPNWIVVSVGGIVSGWLLNFMHSGK